MPGHAGKGGGWTHRGVLTSDTPAELPPSGYLLYMCHLRSRAQESPISHIRKLGGLRLARGDLVWQGGTWGDLGRKQLLVFPRFLRPEEIRRVQNAAIWHYEVEVTFFEFSE
jgi:hypothetical protein